MSACRLDASTRSCSAKRAVTAGTALRLARYFGTSDRFWLNLQARHDLETEKDRLGARLRKEVFADK
jgi:addiction module HigA family antidote